MAYFYGELLFTVPLLINVLIIRDRFWFIYMYISLGNYWYFAMILSDKTYKYLALYLKINNGIQTFE